MRDEAVDTCAVRPILRNGRLFARADLGADVNINTFDSGPFPIGRMGPVLRLNAGVGLIIGQVAVMAESTNFNAPLSNGDVSPERAWFHSVAIAARLTSGVVTPYTALAVQFVDRRPEGISGVVIAPRAAVTIGLEAPL